MSNVPGGWGGIRTPGGVAPTTVFKTVAIDRSATHPKLFIPPVFQTCGFVRCPHLAVLLTTRSHSTALMLVSLTRMQDRRNRPRLPPILNFYTAGLSNLWFCLLSAPTAWVENFGYYTVSKSDCQFICYADYYTCEPERTCYHYPQRGNIKGHHTW